MKAICRMAAAGLLLALLAGCSTGQSSYEWAVEPQLQADKIEPLAVSGGGILEGSLPEDETLLSLCAAQQGELWGLVDGRTGEWVVEPRFSLPPTLCPDGHLLATGPDGALLSDPELDRQLAAYDPDLQTEPGHGGLGVEYVWDEESGQVRRHSWNESGAQSPVLEPDETGELLPVRQGVWEYNQLEGAQVMKAEPKSLYAVATADGTLLTDFVYERARPGSGGLIAVEKKGKWGYLNRQGELVIPCKYDGVWGSGHRPERTGQRQRGLAANLARALPGGRRGSAQGRRIRPAEQQGQKAHRLRKLSGAGPGPGRPGLGQTERPLGTAAAGFRFLTRSFSKIFACAGLKPV